jgi:hypothetical protein
MILFPLASAQASTTCEQLKQNISQMPCYPSPNEVRGNRDLPTEEFCKYNKGSSRNRGTRGFVIDSDNVHICEDSIKHIRQSLQLYEEAQKSHCKEVQNAKDLSCPANNVKQDEYIRQAEELRKKVAAAEKKVANELRTLIRTLKAQTERNQEVIEALEEDRQRIQAAKKRACSAKDQEELQKTDRSKLPALSPKCILLLNSRDFSGEATAPGSRPAAPSLSGVTGSMPVVSFGAQSRTLLQYSINIDRMREEQVRMRQIASEYVEGFETHATTAENRYSSISGTSISAPPSQQDGPPGSDSGRSMTLDNGLKSMQIAQMAGAANRQQGAAPAPAATISAAALPASLNLNQRTGTGSSSSVPGIATQATDSKSDKKIKTESSSEERTSFTTQTSAPTKQGTTMGFTPASSGETKRTVVSGTSTRGGAGSLNSYGRNGNSGGQNGTASSGSTYENSGSRPGFAGGSDAQSEPAVMKNFSGAIHGQVDNLDGQSEIAKILGDMQAMFSGDATNGAPGESSGFFGGSESSELAATSGLGRDDEITRFEKVEKVVSEQGARALASAEGLTDFSLFSRVHRRHVKSLEKGLVISGLRHKVE